VTKTFLRLSLLRLSLLRLSLCLVLWAPCLGASAQAVQTAPPDTFQPIPTAERAGYRFNFAKVFFTDDAAVMAAIKTLDARAARLQGLKGHVLASPQNLYQALKQTDDFNVLFGRVYAYLQLRYSVDTKDAASRDRSTALDARLSPQVAFVNDEVKAVTPQTLARFLAAYPPLRPYCYVVNETVRARPHTLSLQQEQILAATNPLMTAWQSDAYDLLMDRAPWGKVRDTSGVDLDVRQDEGKIANSASRAVRREGHDKTAAAFAAERDLFAFDVVRVAKAQNALARLRHFPNGQDAAFFGLHLSDADVSTAFAQILAHGDLRKRLQSLQRARIASFTGYDVVHSWDMTVVPPHVVKPRFTIDQARLVIETSTAYLGPEWNRELQALLDPANGRLDLVGGPNRVANAFTYPLPYGQSPFYDYAYEGYQQDVSTLAHEAGHAVHQSLMTNAHLAPSLMNGPPFFTESYAILDEMVLDDSLYRSETDPGRRVYFLEKLLQELMSFYGTASIAAVEKGMYEGVSGGTVKTADDLDALTTKIGSQVSVWYALEPDQKDLWEVIPHYYNAPTYYVNYVFADLLAETYFAQYKKDPAGFARRFTALERNGFNDTPTRLLQKFLGINLSDPKTYDAVFRQQQQYLDDLQRLYAQVPVAPPPARQDK